jgi:hypothetical protein
MSERVPVVLHLEPVEVELLQRLTENSQVENVGQYIHLDLVERLTSVIEDTGYLAGLGIDAAPYADYFARKEAEDMARRSKASRARWARMFG